MSHHSIGKTAGLCFAAGLVLGSSVQANEPAAQDPLDRKVQELREESRYRSHATGQAATEAREGGVPQADAAQRPAPAQREAARDAVLRAGVPAELNRGLPPSRHRDGGSGSNGQPAVDVERQAGAGAAGESAAVRVLREESRDVSRAAQQAAVEARNHGTPGMATPDGTSTRDGLKVLGGPAAAGPAERERP